MQELNKYKIFLSPPFQSGEELDYLRKSLESNWLAPGGRFVEKFESDLKTLISRRHCVALNSGTAAVHLALKVLGVERGDHVICQTFSFVASANPIAYLGATPVFVDSEKSTWNMDPELLEQAIIDLQDNGIHPKAIVYTHIFGNLAQVSQLMAISKKYKIPIVEDAAEALGSRFEDRYAGSFGDISILSFNGNKIITTSGGGALLTDNEDWAMRARRLASQARDQKFPFTHSEIGYNYQMSNISAALGLAQLPHLAKWVQKKRSVFSAYQDHFKDLGTYTFVQETGNSYLNRWLSVFVAPRVAARDRIINSLGKNLIESRRFWKPLHLLGIYPAQNAYISDVAISLFERGFCLPSGVGLTERELDSIKKIIKMSE
jgi:dTDP-4-amino-4,6-dideoxygalactose transaminase